MAIKNSAPNNILFTFVNSIKVLDYRLSGVLLHMQKVTLKTRMLNYLMGISA